MIKLTLCGDNGAIWINPLNVTTVTTHKSYTTISLVGEVENYISVNEPPQDVAERIDVWLRYNRVKP